VSFPVVAVSEIVTVSAVEDPFLKSVNTHEAPAPGAVSNVMRSPETVPPIPIGVLLAFVPHKATDGAKPAYSVAAVERLSGAPRMFRTGVIIISPAGS